MVSLDQNLQAKGNLYSDAGDGFDYKKGKFTMAEFEATVSNQNILKITIEKSAGELPIEERYYRIALVNDKGMSYSNWIFGKNLEIRLSELKIE